MSPSFVTEFARNYKHNAQANNLSMRQTYDSVAASFTRIDPNWDRKPTIGSQYALYLKVFASASKDFIELMKSKVSNTNVVMPNVIAPTTINTSITPSSAVAANLIQGMQLPDTDAKGRLKESFPYTLI